MAENARLLAEAFLAWLADERRASPLTVQAYRRDLGFFLGFLADHLGGEPSPADLQGLREADLRAWLAWEAGQARGNRTRARHLSAVRSFFRFLARRHGFTGMAARLINTPKAVPPVPRALPPEQARAVARDIGAASDTALAQARAAPGGRPWAC